MTSLPYRQLAAWPGPARSLPSGPALVTCMVYRTSTTKAILSSSGVTRAFPNTGGVPCVRLRVTGMSFMLHQIRHMIGGALAVARGSLPLPLLRASLAAHARVNVPRAPPHTLVLSDCSFPPFRKVRRGAWSGARPGTSTVCSGRLHRMPAHCA